MSMCRGGGKLDFQPLHLDVLKEVSNIGSAHAATSLSKLLNKTVTMYVPNVKIASYEEVMDVAGGAEEEVVGMFLRIEGDAPGSIFLLLSPYQAEDYIYSLTGISNLNEGGEGERDFAFSALQEISNIMTGAYLTALSDFTGLHLQPSVPSAARDMAGAILSTGLMEMSRVSDYAIAIETSLSDRDREANEKEKGHLFLFPDPDAFENIFQSLGVSSHE
ncbi:chemotaxis protein CheC [Halobacillus litoralis]|uniref:chemotaxis protein CheC n=1 Tax=Halobacillus litoralis TaxID=45668 RepID=UPI001CFE9839|nr:chemotaxis protein CheC [Halobacillus litoralis]